MADPDVCADRGAVQPDVVDLHLHTGETEPGLFHVDQDGDRYGDSGVLLCESFPRRDRRHEDRKSVPAGEYGDGGSHDPCGDCDLDLWNGRAPAVPGVCESVLLDPSGDHSVSCVFPRGTLLEPVGDGDQPFKRGAECSDLSDSGSIVCVPDAERDARASDVVYLCVACRCAQLLSPEVSWTAVPCNGYFCTADGHVGRRAVYV